VSRRLSTGTGLSLGVILALPGAAQAEDFKVTNLDDEAGLDQIPGSLRQAVIDANTTPGADRVVFASKLSGELNLDNAGIYLYGSPIEIIGPGARRVTVDGHDDSRIFTVQPTGGSATISGLTMTNGSSTADGGAINVDEANLTITDSAITNSAATGGATDNGGGIYTQGDSGTPEDLVILNSTISGNFAEDEGGGIYTSEVDLTMRNSTVSGNRARGGAGVYLESSEDTDEISNSTITRNTATEFAGGVRRGPAEIRGSIVAGNAAPDGPDLNGPFAFPVSFSIIGDTEGADIDDEGGNLLGGNPKLKPLKNNGGPTDTHAFKKSPAKNKIPKAQTPKSDQRGAPRKGKGDIGAYELVKCEGVVVNRVGTAGKDKLKGTKKKDGMLGLGGNDKLSGKKGKDGLCGGRGKDKLKGGPGKDKLDGGPGKDREVQ
jgi:hypothetical protein